MDWQALPTGKVVEIIGELTLGHNLGGVNSRNNFETIFLGRKLSNGFSEKKIGEV